MLNFSLGLAGAVGLYFNQITDLMHNHHKTTMKMLFSEHSLSFLFWLILLTQFSTSLQASNSATEKLALLSFKSLINSDPYGKLASWNDSVPDYCQWHGITCDDPRQLKRVTALNLSNLELGGSLSPSLANLTFLRKLDLESNKLFGDIPASLGQCSKLEYLSLANNNLNGNISANISRCSNLVYLYLTNNNLTGSIPAELGLLSNLKVLDLRSNSLSGRIPSEIGNLSTLYYLYLAYNNLEGSIPPELGSLKNLWILDLLLNQLSGTLPDTLFNLSSLYAFGVGGNNNLSGSIPPDFGQKFPNLMYLYLYNNKFEGPIPPSLSNCSNLEDVSLDHNFFSGIVPSNLGILTKLSKFYIWSNLLEANSSDDWSFMSSLTNCSNLVELDISENRFAGLLPDSIGNLSSGMDWLSIRNNRISGRLPPGIGKYRNLRVLEMGTNYLSGNIPESIGDLSRLQTLSLSNSRLSGRIPDSIGKLTQLNKLLLSDNYLTGSIPSSFKSLQKLSILDLSHNNLSGVLPTGLLRLSSLSIYANLSHNSFGGSLPDEVGSLVNLGALDISENKFTGMIPTSIGACQVLQFLHLGGNLFSESIPKTMENLKGLQLLNLSHNHLSGSIPDFLESLNLSQYLDLSFNYFQGEVPTKGIFKNINLYSVQGNKDVCGGNPELHLQSCKTTEEKSHDSHTKLIVIVICSVILLLLLLICLFAKYFFRAKCRVFHPIQSMKDRHLSISYRELYKATDRFSLTNLIGSGSFGTVYKGTIGKEGKCTIVAVKVLNCEQVGASRSFRAECKVLRSIRHRNLIRVLSVCSSIDFAHNDFKAIIYEFMPNGNLEMWLHSYPNNLEDPRSLSIRQRLSVAIDVASALDYLHHQGHVPVVHCDLKPNNILLDYDMTARVGDFGLARFLSRNISTSYDNYQNQSSTIGIKGSIGYIPPEYGMGGSVSTAGDVYSYGILLLEMFTGCRPTDDTFKDDLSLCKYVETSFPDNVMHIIDPHLHLENEMKDERGTINYCLVSLFRIGLACCRELPVERIGMKEVLKNLNLVKDLLQGA